MPIAIERILPGNWQAIRRHVASIEELCYELTRRDTPESFDRIVNHSTSVSFAAFDDATVAGFCFAAPLEMFIDVRGVTADSEFGKNTTLYSADVTVTPEYQGRGIGRLLKLWQIAAAQELGYSYVAGRNRAGLAPAIHRINQSLGAVTVQLLRDDYPDTLEQRDCIYYHIAVKPSNKRCASLGACLEFMGPSVRPIGRATQERQMDPQSTAFPLQPSRP